MEGHIRVFPLIFSDDLTLADDLGNSSWYHGSKFSGFLNIPSLDDSGKGFVEESVKVLDDSSPELRHENPVSSQGS
ncbi:hypothetical protein L6452_43745 [Arctium lappa]|uniref:Uncharacterized protein n=1 Tax=Arctium lappa TaxID=4217 RepID=A0ACB8XEJ9_ARCLA|nr:hypothetical protein L6452_43745 [Arctium lappa]